MLLKSYFCFDRHFRVLSAIRRLAIMILQELQYFIRLDVYMYSLPHRTHFFVWRGRINFIYKSSLIGKTAVLNHLQHSE